MEIQRAFLDQIEQHYSGPRKELISALSSILGVNVDGVYRRLRGETPISLDEAMRINQSFPGGKLSFDHGHVKTLIANNPAEFLTLVTERFKEYFKQESTTLYFDAKELPLFYLFHHPRLFAFKQQFWTMGTMNDRPKVRVNPHQDYQVLLNWYESQPSTELWSYQVINSTLRQIEYSGEIDWITKQEAVLLLEELQSLLERLQSYCEKGMKSGGGELNVYVNNVLIGNNSLLVEQGEGIVSFLSENIIDLIQVTDRAFNEKKLEHFKRVLQKSTPLMVTSQKERKRFFSKLNKDIESVLSSF